MTGAGLPAAICEELRTPILHHLGKQIARNPVHLNRLSVVQEDLRCRGPAIGFETKFSEQFNLPSRPREDHRSAEERLRYSIGDS